MKIPEWLKPAIWGALCGAAVLAFVGFNEMGWHGPKGTEQIASERAETAVTTAMVPFCVAKAKLDPDHAGLVKVQNENSDWTRSEMVSKAGWATVGTSTDPDNALARACSDKLHAMASS